MIRILSIILLSCLTLLGYGQVYNPNINSTLNRLEHATSLVKEFETFGIKATGSKQKENTFNWLVSQYQSYGYDSIWIDSFAFNGATSKNIVVTKSGVLPEYIVVCGHYDSRGGPGASDNGSGVAAILETARLVKHLTTNRGIIFIHFDSEEDGFKGSQHYVDQVIGGAGDGNLYMVLNVDQIGGSRGAIGNDKIKCERDEEAIPSQNNALSAKITDTVAQLSRIYTKLVPVITKAFSSDYLPFEQSGYVITGLYQNADDLFSHSPADTFGNLDTMSFKEAVRLTTAAVLHFAQVGRFVSAQKIAKAEIHIYPNPAKTVIHVDSPEIINSIVIRDINGSIIYETELNDNSIEIDVDRLSQGYYIISVKTFINGYARVPLFVIE